jgi:secondary thiamine-phosphate synthase enzyme
MQIHQETLKVSTQNGFSLYDLTAEVQHVIDQAHIRQGQVLLFVQHTTTALAINENETRLWEDIRTFAEKLAPAGDRYLHNDLHLRTVPPDEPQNAHAHLIAMLMNTNETIPVADGRLQLGQYQSILLIDLDGPRTRQIHCQVWGLS